MWGFGLEHELRLGFSKKIIPNINILVNFLEKKDDESSKNFLKIIYKNFNKNTINLQNDYNEFQISNIEHIFNIKFNLIKNFDINDVYYMLEYVTIILSDDMTNIILKHLENNIMNYYIDNYNNLEDDIIKTNTIFKQYKNNTESINIIKNFLIDKNLYNIRKNKSDIETIIKLDTTNIKKIKFFDDVKFNNDILYNLYYKYIISNYYRFINGYLNFVILDKNKSLNILNILNNIELNYLYKYTINFNKITLKNIIKNIKIDFLNKISIKLNNNNEKELFPDFTKSSISMKIVLHQTQVQNNNIFDVKNYQTLFIENIKYKLLSKSEILTQMEYLFDCYIYLSNQNMNFMDLSSEFYLEKRYCFKINYPIKYLINMLYNESISIDWTPTNPLIEYKNLNYKNVQIENVVKEVEIYQNIYIKLLNEIYKNSIYSIYGEIVEMIRGGDKNLIYINTDNNLDNIIHNNDYFGSYHIWFTMPSTTLNNFVNEHIKFAKLLQWCEPLFFVFYTNNIYNEFGTYRYLLNFSSGYGTSDPDLLKPIDKHNIQYYYDGRDENTLLTKIIKDEFIKKAIPINVNIYDKNDKKILNYNRLSERNVTVEEIKKRFDTNKKVKTYLDILWENTNKEDTNIGADLRNPLWQTNFEKKIEKNWVDVIIRKKNGKFYKYYFNIETEKLRDTPPYKKIQNSDRVGFEYRVFDNMDIKFIYNIMFFCVLVYVAIINKKKDNLSKAIQSQCWNNTIANCLIHGVNKFKLSNEYTKQLCNMLEINNIYKNNMVDFFQYCIDELHKKYKNNPIFKKLVKNNEFNVKIPNMNLYFYELNKVRQQNEQLIL
jgi:hypothetical protein